MAFRRLTQKAKKSFRRSRKSIGTPIGYKHDWVYKHLSEKEYAGGRFKYNQIKTRKHKTRFNGGFRPGSKLVWVIKAKERITRTPSGYKHIIRGYKRQGAYKLRGQRKWQVNGQKRR